MYPSTKFIIEDRSAINEFPINEQINAPKFAQFFSSDKGPEEMGMYYGEDFKIFGEPNFARHGQPLLQAQTLINNGAQVLAKRIVADDATLANLIVLAKVKQTEKQKTNEDGKPLYTTAEGEETTEADGNTAVMIKKCHIEYELKTVENNHNDIEDLKASALALVKHGEDDEEKVFPIALVADNGRGVSAKKIKITANTVGSRNREYLSYVLSVIEDSVVAESTVFALNPNLNSGTTNLSLTSVSKTYLKEVRVFGFDDIMAEFLAIVKELSGVENVDNIDVLFGKDKKGQALNEFEIEGEVNLAIPVGMPLQSGSNGDFGNFPIRSKTYTKVLTEAFNGTFTEDIYDVDNILLDCILDANYPDAVKKAIEALVEFREDCVFLRDLGTGLFTAEDIISKAAEAAKSRYVAVYGNSWDVIDPYSKKQITVTPGYNLAKLLPKHMSEKRHAPLAGQLHGFTFDDIVEGTVNFLPKTIPGKDQKEELFEKRINFISYFNNIATMESEYTTQEEYTGFSFVNNTLAVQEIIKAIRINCPKARYSFMEEDDLTKYEEDVKAILDKYSSNFSKLEMKYMADPTYEQNMIFYAVLQVQFKKFIQAEVFRIIAINGDDTTSTL